METCGAWRDSAFPPPWADATTATRRTFPPILRDAAGVPDGARACNTHRMLSVESARALVRSGLFWEPKPGDRFVVEVDELAGEVFWVSQMTIAVQHTPTGRILGFNGVTEWALDNVALDQALWLPSECQLREQLGDHFVSLTRSGDRFSVAMLHHGLIVHFEAGDSEDAYAAALLALLRTAYPAET